MNKKDYRDIVREVIGILSEPPPGKTKRTQALTELSDDEIRAVVNGLRPDWAPGSAETTATTAGVASKKKATPSKKGGKSR